jgi:hypothetical protein
MCLSVDIYVHTYTQIQKKTKLCLYINENKFLSYMKGRLPFSSSQSHIQGRERGSVLSDRGGERGREVFNRGKEGDSVGVDGSRERGRDGEDWGSAGAAKGRERFREVIIKDELEDIDKGESNDDFSIWILFT